MNNDRLIDRNIELVDLHEIIFPRGIIAIEPNRIGSVHQFRLHHAKLTVFTGVMDIPGKLFGHHPQDQRVFFIGNSFLTVIQMGVEKKTRSTTSKA